MTIDPFGAQYRLPMLCAGLAMALTSALTQQQPTRSLTLAQAVDAAQRASPDVRAAREAVAAATARERQAGAYPNPTLSYGREQTSASGATSSQNIAALEQRVELGGLRSVRQEAARLRRDVAVARLGAAQAQVAFETTRAYALAIAGERRAVLAEQAAVAFARASSVSERRLTAGDVSGYAHRRMRLEAARYAVIRSEAVLARNTARLTLATLVSGSVASIQQSPTFALDSLSSRAAPNEMSLTSRDSLIRLALRSRSDLHALEVEVAVAEAEARLATRERIPTPAFSLGFKNERAAQATEAANGFVAGISIPLPLWDRRAGAVAAADAESRRRRAEVEVFERRVVREVTEAYDAYVALAAQLDALSPQLDAETQNAMSAVQVAYSEGEITLVEWLDAVRAYYEAESSFATLRAETLIRRAALERAVGVSLSGLPNTRGGAAPSKD